MLSQYVVSGKIDTERIAKGEQAVFVTRSDSPFKAGDSITVGSAQGTDTASQTEYIKCITDKKTTIGAVVCLPDDAERVLRYCVLGGLISSPDKPAINHCLLTTVTGAQRIGLHGAMYSELLSQNEIGDKLPMGTGFELFSLKQQQKQIFRQNAQMYISMGLVILLMSLLGFAAYFNGIGMKIRGKEYQIGVMRAVGTPLKRLRRKLTLDSIKIPIISSAFAYGLMRAAQQIMMNAKDRYDMLAQQAAAAAGTGNTEMYNELNNKAELVGQRYLIGSQMWYVNALIPTVVIFAVICMVTILLTRRSVGGFGSNIAYSISRGRKRR